MFSQVGLTQMESLHQIPIPPMVMKRFAIVGRHVQAGPVVQHHCTDAIVGILEPAAIPLPPDLVDVIPGAPPCTDVPTSQECQAIPGLTILDPAAIRTNP